MRRVLDVAVTAATAAGLLTLATFLDVASARRLRARPDAGAVLVANGVAHPVPVSGSVSVHDPTDATAPIVAQRIESRVQQDVSGVMAPLYAVPDGQRLVVDHFSATIVGSAPDQNIVFGISGSELNALPGQVLPATTVGTSVVGYTASSALHLIFDGGTTVFGLVNRSVGGGLVRPSLTVTFWLSGRLVSKSPAITIDADVAASASAEASERGRCPVSDADGPRVPVAL